MDNPTTRETADHAELAECWKPIPNEAGYLASNLGRIMGPRGRPLSPDMNRRGYLRVSVRGRTKSVHRLVCRAWFGEMGPEVQVNHIDGCKTNNTLANLELCDVHENRAHAKLTGLYPRGETATRSRITKSQALALLESAESNSAAARRLGVSESSVRRIRSGENWKYLVNQGADQ